MKAERVVFTPQTPDAAAQIVLMLYENLPVIVSTWSTTSPFRRAIYRKAESLQKLYGCKLNISSQPITEGDVTLYILTPSLTKKLEGVKLDEDKIQL